MAMQACLEIVKWGLRSFGLGFGAVVELHKKIGSNQYGLMLDKPEVGLKRTQGFGKMSVCKYCHILVVRTCSRPHISSF